jgi:hypothetical protein
MKKRWQTLSGSTGVDQVLLGSTRFYRVLQGSFGFYGGVHDSRRNARSRYAMHNRLELPNHLGWPDFNESDA